MAESEIEFAGSPNKPEITKDGFDQEELTLRKRLPRKLPKRKNDVYVNRRTDIRAQLARCHKLFESGYTEIYIHGLGAAINRAMTLALQLKSKGLGTLDVAANTSTVELIDDLEPNTDEAEADTQSRNNSAVHIKVFCVDLLPSELSTALTDEAMNITTSSTGSAGKAKAKGKNAAKRSSTGSTKS